jgi:hypothetical protein
MVITAVADRVPERIRALIYLDAYVPRDGQCVLDIRSADKNTQLMQRVESEGEGWLMPPTPAAEFGVETDADRRFVDSKCVSMPLVCFTQAVSLSRPPADSIDLHFILARRNTNPSFRLHHEHFLDDPRWRTYEVDCGHDVMVDRPQWLASLLSRIE